MSGCSRAEAAEMLLLRALLLRGLVDRCASVSASTHQCGWWRNGRVPSRRDRWSHCVRSRRCRGHWQGLMCHEGWCRVQVCTMRRRWCRCRVRRSCRVRQSESERELRRRERHWVVRSSPPSHGVALHPANWSIATCIYLYLLVFTRNYLVITWPTELLGGRYLYLLVFTCIYLASNYQVCTKLLSSSNWIFNTSQYWVDPQLSNPMSKLSKLATEHSFEHRFWDLGSFWCSILEESSALFQDFQPSRLRVWRGGHDWGRRITHPHGRKPPGVRLRARATIRRLPQHHDRTDQRFSLVRGCNAKEPASTIIPWPLESVGARIRRRGFASTRAGVWWAGGRRALSWPTHVVVTPAHARFRGCAPAVMAWAIAMRWLRKLVPFASWTRELRRVQPNPLISRMGFDRFGSRDLTTEDPPTSQLLRQVNQSNCQT